MSCTFRRNRDTYRRSFHIPLRTHRQLHSFRKLRIPSRIHLHRSNRGKVRNRSRTHPHSWSTSRRIPYIRPHSLYIPRRMSKPSRRRSYRVNTVHRSCFLPYSSCKCRSQRISPHPNTGHSARRIRNKQQSKRSIPFRSSIPFRCSFYKADSCRRSVPRRPRSRGRYRNRRKAHRMHSLNTFRRIPGRFLHSRNSHHCTLCRYNLHRTCKHCSWSRNRLRRRHSHGTCHILHTIRRVHSWNTFPRTPRILPRRIDYIRCRRHTTPQRIHRILRTRHKNHRRHSQNSVRTRRKVRRRHNFRIFRRKQHR